MRKFSKKNGEAAAIAAPPRSEQFGRLARFAAVGASGLVVNLVALALLLMGRLGSLIVGGDALSAIIATQLAVAWNFALTERWAFSGHYGHWLRRLPLFWVLSCAALLAQLPLAATLQPMLGGSYLLATGAAVGILMLTRFTVCDRWLYRRRGAGSHRAPSAPATVS
ncbi:GtrA family protein [Arthrobacter sp. FW306-04-A]|uniref:GtrA family protein n=1 Tax=Arthrobacter sp. FW306-04-A TaxID=2879619 RepID=UPI0037C09E00|nr:GtrA family protein [Arthrobacter sp. FW306-04-A]